MPLFNFAPLARDNDILAELDRWNREATDSDRQYKYRKMICSPFVFYRGTNHLFWRDFAKHTALKTFSSPQTKIWIQGDLHAENFGSFHNDEGVIVYDLNDFDEAVIADYQYDLWRMAVSLILVARQNRFKPKAQREFVRDFALGYLTTIAQHAQAEQEPSELEFTAKNTYGKLDDFLKDVAKNESRKDMLKKWTNVDNGDRYCDLSSNKLAAIDPADRAAIIQQMPEYGKTLTGALSYCPEYFQVKDIARRLLAGTGSLGKPRFYILIEGEDEHHAYDCILDMKYQGKPTPYYYLGKKFQTTYNQQFTNDAQRQMIAYKALAKNADDHLGWLELNGDFYSIRERSPYKEAFPLDILSTKKRFRKMAEQWGKILATSHSRADQDAKDSKINHEFDAAVYQVTLGKETEFCELIEKIAVTYADQVELDYQAFKTAHPDLTCLE